MTMPVQTRKDQGTIAAERGDRPTSPAKGGRFTTTVAFACLALLAPWLVFCYISLGQSDPVHWLAGLAWLIIAIEGVCVLAFVGTAFGLAATFGTGRKRGWGVLALGLNALILVVSLTIVIYINLGLSGALGGGHVEPAPVETDR